MLVIAMNDFFSRRSTTYMTSYGRFPGATNTLVTPGQLTVAGSSTVGPIATEEINQRLQGAISSAYWNNLVSTGVSYFIRHQSS